MVSLKKALGYLLLCSSIAFSAALVPKLVIQEQDGSPSGQPAKLKVTNSTLTDNGDGTFSLTTGSGGGGGGSPNGSVNSSDYGNASYYSVPGSSNVLSGSSFFQINTTTVAITAPFFVSGASLTISGGAHNTNGNPPKLTVKGSYGTGDGTLEDSFLRIDNDVAGGGTALNILSFARSGADKSYIFWDLSYDGGDSRGCTYLTGQQSPSTTGLMTCYGLGAAGGKAVYTSIGKLISPVRTSALLELIPSAGGVPELIINRDTDGASATDFVDFNSNDNATTIASVNGYGYSSFKGETLTFGISATTATISSNTYVAGSTFTLKNNGSLAIGEIRWADGTVQVSSPPAGGGSGSGTVNSATINQAARYAATGTAVSGSSIMDINTSSINVTGSLGAAVTYSITGGSVTVNDLTASQIVRTDSNKKLISSASLTTTELVGVLAAAQEPVHTGNITNTAGSLFMTAQSVSLSTQVVGTLQAAQEPAHTGNMTNSAGSLFTTVSAVSLSTQVVGVLPVANGGTGTASTLTGLVRGNASAMTAAEMSGDGTTSGSNALTLAAIQANVRTFTSTITVANTGGFKTTGPIIGTTFTFIGANYASQVTSNTILANTTFYQDGTVIIGPTATPAVATDFILTIASANATVILGVTQSGHLVSSGTYTPSVSSCGTSPSMDPDATDFSGTINTGSASPTACTLTFATAFVNKPTCIVSDDLQTAEPAITARSTTAITITLGAALNSGHLFYVCVGQKG